MVVATALAELRELRGPRIGGIVAPRGVVIDPSAVEKMRVALGPGAQLLLAPGVVADADACCVDGVGLHDFSRARARLHQIDGAFAVAWHEPGGAIVLASDPIGHRRLYYARRADGVLIFASTLRGVLSSGLIPRRLAHAAIPFFLTFAYLPTQRTLAEGVFALPPGAMLELDRPEAAMRITPFWQLPGTPTTFADEAELGVQLRTELENAVQRALPSDGAALGCTLSGGIDSSLVVALARKLHRGRLCTYSISFGGEHRNELPWSELVARHCGAERVIVEVSPCEVMLELDATVAALSQPNGDPLTVPNTLLFRRAASDTRVMLNGEGGDPCFGGPKNAPMLLAELLGQELQSAGPLSRACSYLRAHQKCYDDLPAMLQPGLAAELLPQLEMEQLVDGWLREPRWPHLLDKLMAINVAFKGAHHILPKVDHLSFASGVCPRSPLFDRRVVELSFAIPAGLKRHGAIEKYLLKQAVRDLLPAAILERPKSGMMVPVEAWFTGPLRAFATERLLDGLMQWDLFDRQWLRKLVDAQLGGLRPRHGVKIWLLLTLEAWLRQVLRDD